LPQTLKKDETIDLTNFPKLTKLGSNGFNGFKNLSAPKIKVCFRADGQFSQRF
jgi:hypothetical protein